LKAAERREAEKVPDDGSKAESRKAARQLARAVFESELALRVEAAVATDQPFVERLVRFWSNHFTVSKQQSNIAHLIGAFEREAIRPHVAGRFEDLLLAVVRHPAMLMYLDNHQSVGPASKVGIECEVGMNENLAREILELHTLGVNGGYSQADIIALAQMLTGWGVLLRPAPTAGEARPDDTAYRFAGARHQPGPQRLLGRDFDAKDARQAEDALRFVARQPATARFVCGKLARHFVADTPSAKLVDALSAVFVESGGDLRRVVAALLAHPESWASPPSKLRTPEEWLIAVGRALGPAFNSTQSGRFEGPGAAWVYAQDWIGQPAFNAPSPAGWPDTQEAWSSPEQLLRRISMAEQIGRRATRYITDVNAWLAGVLGAAAPAALTEAVAGAPNAAVAIALVFSSPTFLRR
jgi:uncharacterized protein (DUF1800 family)